MGKIKPPICLGRDFRLNSLGKGEFVTLVSKTTHSVLVLSGKASPQSDVARAPARLLGNGCVRLRHLLRERVSSRPRLRARAVTFLPLRTRNLPCHRKPLVPVCSQTPFLHRIHSAIHRRDLKTGETFPVGEVGRTARVFSLRGEGTGRAACPLAPSGRRVFISVSNVGVAFSDEKSAFRVRLPHAWCALETLASGCVFLLRRGAPSHAGPFCRRPGQDPGGERSPDDSEPERGRRRHVPVRRREQARPRAGQRRAPRHG